MGDCSSYPDYLLALALGDALGRPFEIEGRGPSSDWLYLDPSQLKGIEVNGRYAYSDDTETALILAEALVKGCGFNPYVFASLLAAKADIDNPVRGYGTAVTVVVLGLRDGKPWWVSARKLYGGQGSMGNGALVRVLPLALFYHGTGSLETMAVAQALVTHTNPLAVEGARLTALIYSMILNGYNVEEAAEKALRETYLPQYRSMLRRALELKAAKPPEVARELGIGALATETLATAVHVAARSGGDPLAALSYSVSLGGDVDSRAAVAVPMAAMESGSLGSLSRFVSKLEGSETIAEMGVRLCRARKDCWRSTPYI